MIGSADPGDMQKENPVLSKGKRLFGSLLTLVLLASACTGNQTSDTTPSSQVATTVGTGEPDAAQGGLKQGVPPISTLSAEEPIVAPGEVVTLTGSPQLNGELRLIGPDGTDVTAPFTGGSGSADLPPDATEGEWQAVVTSDTGAIALGSVKVATGPSLLLVSDRSHVAPAGDVTVTLYARGLHDDARVMFGWGNLDWNAYFEDTEEEGEEPLGVLIPDQNGLLQLGDTPAALSDVVGKPLLMGGGLEISGLQAMVFSNTSDDFYLSDPLRLEGCPAPVSIQGTMGGPGSIHLLSLGDGLRSAGIDTTDGSFAVDAPHGPTRVFAALDDGGPLDPIGFNVPCAGSVELDLVSGTVDIVDPRLLTAVEEDVFVAGESGTVTLSGDQSATFPVEPVCHYSGGSIDIIFATFDLDLPAVQMSIGGGEVSGSHGGTVEITDWTDVTQSTGDVEVSIEYAPGVALAEAVMNLAGVYAGAAGTGTIEGTFSCFVLGLAPPAGETSSSEPEEETNGELLVELPATVFDTPGLDPAITAPPCRIVVVDDLGSLATGIQTAARLRAALSRATVVTLSEMHTMFGPDQRDMPWGPGRSSSVSFAVDEGTPIVLVENESDADGLIGSVLCVDVEPIDVALGETARLVVRATDLNGQPVADTPIVIAESELGTVEPSQGELIDGVFQADFTGGSASGEGSLTLELGGDAYPATIAFASVANGLSYTMEGQNRVVLNPSDPDVPIPPGPLGATLVARSCAGRSGPWDGVLILEAGPLLTMIELTGFAGGIAATLFGTQMELQEESLTGDLIMPFPDVGLSLLVVEGLNTNPGVLAPIAQQLRERFVLSNSYEPFVVPVDFFLPSGTEISIVNVNGETSGFSLHNRATGRNQVQLKAEGEHLLKAVIRRAPGCMTHTELVARIVEIVSAPAPR